MNLFIYVVLVKLIDNVFSVYSVLFTGTVSPPIPIVLSCTITKSCVYVRMCSVY